MSEAWSGGSTRAWRKLREQVLERDGHRCRLKLDGCTGRATHVHHTKGKAKGDDPADLLSSCEHCNLKVGDPTATTAETRSASVVTELVESPAVEHAPAEPVLIRSASVVGVNFAQRIIEFVAAPYEEEAVVLWRGEPWRELFERGAWDGIEKRPNRIKANREHDKSRTVGKVVNFWPSRAEGLVGAARISQTPLGDETLALADDGVIGPSVGYVARPRDVELVKAASPGLRRVKRAFMDHLSFVPDPTWEGATVLAVRSLSAGAAAEQLPPVDTPELDQLRAWMSARKH